MIADHSNRTVGIVAAALTAAVTIPLILALRPILENERRMSGQATIITRRVSVVNLRHLGRQMSFPDVTDAASHWAFLSYVGTPGSRAGYRRLRRVGTRTPWQRWRENIYLRKLDRLPGRASWKFLRSIGDYSYRALRLLPELSREWKLHQSLLLTTSAALIIVRFAEFFAAKATLYSCRHRSNNGCLTGLEATNDWFCDRP